MIRFAVISAFSDDWHAARLVEACRARGAVDVMTPTMFSLRADASRGAAVLAGGHDARCWDVWLTPRALGDEGDHDFQCVVYTALGELGLPVVNPVPGLLTAIDKARCSWLLTRAGIPTPPAVAVQTVDEALAALAVLGAVVAKPPFGSLGIGVERIDAGPGGRARRSLATMLKRHRVIYLQRFVEDRLGRGRDVRLFVVGDSVAGAIARRSGTGDFRTNMHQGGQAEAYAPDPAMAKMAVRAARSVGLEYAGVDVVETTDGPTVLEVNGTPRWDGIHRVTGQDMAGEIVAHATALIHQPRQRESRWLTRRTTRPVAPPPQSKRRRAS